MSQDVSLLYYGGSGGNFCLHLLMLAGNYNCIFNSDIQDFDTIFQNQWNINQIGKWKTTETSVENDRTLHANLSNKIYLKCNPDKHSLTRYPGTTVVIYTDIETQIYLAKTKNAFWFFKNNPQEEMLVRKYNSIKAKEWPTCYSMAEFDNLPETIKEECLTEWEFNRILDTAEFVQLFRAHRQILYKGDYILGSLKDIIDIDQADIKVKLQDLIKTKGRVLFDQLGLQANAQTDNFVDMYVNLHTPEQQNYLLNN